jgi:Na+-transporting NADH:ubiquinone oxidoreductase subunit F
MITVILIAALLLVIALALLLAERFLVSHEQCTITVNGEKRFIVESGDTLLSVLTQHKLFVPSACGGKATCGLCKIPVPSGAGPILPTEQPFLTREEQAQGIRLACQVKVQRNLEVRLPESMLAAREYEALVTEIQSLTYDTKLVRFDLGSDELLFKPGQYVQLLVPGTDQFRAYSIASPPSRARRAEVAGSRSQVPSPEVELIVRYVPGGLCTGWIHRALEVGDRVKLTGPFGDFYLREDSGREIVAIGGGSGMAPMRSIVLHLAEQKMPRRVTLYFGARSRRDLFYVDEFRRLEDLHPNFRYIPALSEPRPEDEWDGETGFVTQVASRHVTGDGEKEAVLCGPPPMIDAAMRVLPCLGVKPEHIYFDKF